MRTKANFSVFGRKLASGKVVFYYQCYDGKGRRTNARSTGLAKKTAAVAYCMALFRAGDLIPRPKCPTFGEYAAGWWNSDTCRYLQWRQLHNKITASTVAIHKTNLDLHIRPFFEKMVLDGITANDIENWLAVLKNKKLKNSGDTLKNNTVNLIYRTLRLMMGEAVRRGLITANPTATVKDLENDDRDIEILKLDEVRLLFPPRWETVWDNFVVFKANKLAAFTGMRIGELLGLRGECVFDDYIRVCGQYSRKYGFTETKTKKNRDIPITKVIRADLGELVKLNGEGYLFSEDRGVTPVNRTKMYRGFDAALDKIGIDHNERLRRGISVHGWRHFLNTTLRMANVADSKVQKLTGHRSMKMTEHYTHFDTREFTEVRKVQGGLLPAPKTAAGRKVKPAKGKAAGKESRAGAARKSPKAQGAGDKVRAVSAGK